MKFLSNNVDDTNKIADELYKKLNFNSIIYLDGNIGTGKTTFTKRIAENFGITTITSSSFSIVSVYQSTIKLIHCDFYRDGININNTLEEIYQNLTPPWILVVEWPRFLIPINAECVYHIKFENLNFHRRIIEFILSD